MSQEVASKKTPWTLDELFGALDRAWSSAGLEKASPVALAVLAAQASVECGRLGKYCYNHNVSNIMGVSPEGLYHTLKNAPECALPEKVPSGGKVVETSIKCPPGQVAYLPPGGSRFRAYSSLDRAAEDKVLVLLRIWPKAMEALSHGGEVGDRASAFVQALLKPAYFSGDPVTYLTTVRSIAREYLEAAKAYVESRPLTTPPPSDPILPTLLSEKPVEHIVLSSFLASLADEPNEQ